MSEDNIIHPEDKELFLRTLNHKGFLLEDKTWKILENSSFLKSLSRNKVIDCNGERIELDLVFVSDNHNLVIECKRTDFSWIFPKAQERSNVLNIISDSNEGIKVKTIINNDFNTAWYDVAVEFKEEGRLNITNNRDNLAKTSYKDIHDHIKQVLKETEAYLSCGRYLGKLIMPVIVTNAPLYFLKYSKGDIDSNGNLIDYTNLEEVEGVVYNFAEVMRWDRGRQTIANSADSLFQDHVKSVFIVNINHLDSFLSKMLDESLLISINR